VPERVLDDFRRISNRIQNVMARYTKTELEEAERSLVSTLSKCEKALLKLKGNSAQRTLLERRIKALRISVDLIKAAMVAPPEA